MRAHEENARALAETLVGDPRVEAVFFPGLPDHPGHEIAKRQMRGVPGMISLRLAGGRAAVDRFVEALDVFTLAESLGGVESLVCYPFTMTHGAIPAEEKVEIGITENLVRLSVGIEEVDDLVADVRAGLDAAEASS
jgi:cystathionine beta-lyase/cystathionine gamma-synthase